MYSITKKQIFGTPKGDTIMFFDERTHLRSAKKSEVRIITEDERQKAADIAVQICQHWMNQCSTVSEFFDKLNKV